MFGVLSPRPTTRVRRVVDDLNQPPVPPPTSTLRHCPVVVGSEAQVAVPTAAAPFSQGLQNPGNPNGARLQAVWREMGPDGDGVANFLDKDSDNDGLMDIDEGQTTMGKPLLLQNMARNRRLNLHFPCFDRGQLGPQGRHHGLLRERRRNSIFKGGVFGHAAPLGIGIRAIWLPVRIASDLGPMMCSKAGSQDLKPPV